MADTKYSLPQVLHILHGALKEKLTKFESDVAEMRARELASTQGKLAKHEMCPLCGGADRNGICNCLKKNAVMGYPNSQGDASMTKHVASSSAAALAPAAPKPQTSVAQANKELGGFKSIAHSPTGPGARVAPMPAKKFNISGAGRGNAATRTASGTIGAPAAPAMKSEKNMGSARSPYGTGAAGHASTKNMPSSLRANINQNTNHSGDERMKKDELPAQKAVPEKKVDGAKMPKAGKKIEAKGSGGQLRKDGLAMRAPEGAGVPGKQPVGQGGGDAHKTAATKAFATNIPKPNVAPGKKQPKSPMPASVDIDVSDFDTGPAKRTFAPAPAAAAPANNKLRAAGAADVGRLQGEGDKHAQASLKADKRAGGVGFLNALIRKFRPLAPAQGQQGSLTSQRFHGTTALRRAEPDALTYAGAAETKRLSNKKDGLKAAGGADVKRMKANKIMGHPTGNITKAEDMGDCAVCKKPEAKCLCKGLSGVNHNRTMLSVTPKRSKKSR